MAFHSDVPGFEEPVCFVENKDPQALVDKMMSYLDQMMSYLDQMADVVFDKRMESFEPVFADIDQTLSDIAQNDLLTSLILYTNLKKSWNSVCAFSLCVALIAANMISISSGHTCSSD